MKLWAPVVVFSVVARLGAQSDPATFFQQNVRPVLTANCVPCHNGNTHSSGLALDSREGALAGGNRGVVVKPGSAADSILIQAVEQKGDLKMPPGRRLTDEQIAALKTWIDQGAVWPQETAAAKKPGFDYWAFQRPRHSDPPAVKNTAWVRNPVDAFVLARLEQEGIKPSPEANKYTLLRRVSLDLTGLPPTPAEIRDFLADNSPNAYEKVVDRLLASPHYGEQWGRRWLDLARYADSDGYTIDDPRPIWKYRDWVIQALNRDQPYNQFVIEQIAGDLLPDATTDQLIATGFHRNTPSNFEGGVDFEQYRNEAVADRVATTGAVFMGLSLGCARCHDHKYDPITQREFYQIFAYFNNTDEITTEAERPDFNRPILELPAPEETAKLATWSENLAKANREVVERVRTLAAKPLAPNDPPKHKDTTLTTLVGSLRTQQRSRPRVTSTLVMRELPQPRPAYIQLGGEFTRKGASVTPGVPAVLSNGPVGNSRLDFARWLVDPSNPLTARVTVNRFWQVFFGKGIVETENDFGLAGAKPSHQELLDWLATEFMTRGWSQKAIQRLIVTSATYRQSSNDREDLEERDPYNKLLARQSRLRLDAEVLRDSALTASGLLNPAVGGPSVYPPVPAGAMGVTQIPKPWPTSFGPDRFRRGLYTFTYRSSLHPSLSLFDAPAGDTSCTRRVRSNSPLQALTLLNDSAYLELAVGMADRLVKEAAPTDDARLNYAFQLALGRGPRPAERPRVQQFLAAQRDDFATNPAQARKVIRNERSVAETVEAINHQPGGAQSPRGRAVSQEEYGRRDEIKKQAEQWIAAHDSLDEKQIVTLATWTAVSRVLLNLDDFVTRD